jgi:hypothetical protein
LKEQAENERKLKEAELMKERAIKESQAKQAKRDK